MDAREWFQEGQLLLRKGEHEKSVDAFTHAMAEGWDRRVSLISRGVAHLLAAHAEKAAGDFTEAVQLDGTSSRTFHYRGSAYMLMKDYRRAIGDFTRALEIDHDFGAALLDRAVCNAQTGNYGEAAADIKRALMVAETDAQRLADVTGMWRTHLEGVLGVLHQHTDLTEEQIAKLREYFES